MKGYLISKYWKGALSLFLSYLFCLAIFDTHDEAMTGVVCFFSLGWGIKVMAAASNDNLKKQAMLIGGLFGLPKLVWYVVTLKPLRRWLFRLYYVGIRPAPYPYLALYGGLLDTHMMMYKMSAAFYRDKTPMARAALWRLLARGAIQLCTNTQGEAGLRVDAWSHSPSDGLDDDLEHALYNFLAQSTPVNGAINPNDVLQVMTYFKKEDGRKKWKKEPVKEYDAENQFRFADLLNTGINLKAYTKRDVQNIFGMKRFLKGLPKSYDKYVAPQLANAALTGAQMPELRLVWKEYMAYAYLFGIERSVMRSLSRMMNPSDPEYQLLQQLTSSPRHRRALKRLMDKVSRATPAVEDSVAGTQGLMPIAWHHEEVYDL